jgi:hypothetical protein
VIVTEDSFLKDNTFSLEFDCLQEVTKFELDASELCDAGCYLLIHGACYLHQ